MRAQARFAVAGFDLSILADADTDQARLRDKPADPHASERAPSSPSSRPRSARERSLPTAADWPMLARMRLQKALATGLAAGLAGLILIVAGSAYPRVPKDVATAERVWRQVGIDNYTLDIAIDECMACGGPGPLRYSAVVTNGEKTSETDPPGQKPGYARPSRTYSG